MKQRVVPGSSRLIHGIVAMLLGSMVQRGTVAFQPPPASVSSSWTRPTTTATTRYDDVSLLWRAAATGRDGQEDLENDGPMKDIMTRFRQQKQQQEKEDETITAPKLFSDDLLQDMQQVLLLLEQRAKQGPGTLNRAQLQDFTARSQRILVEMKGFYQIPIPSSTSSFQSRSEPSSSVSSSSTGTTTKASSSSSSSSASSSSSNRLSDDSEDGPGYDPNGGFGSVAKGTVNTYMIPGMDAMSPEEYQKALQQSIIDRQSERKKRAMRNAAVGSYSTYGNNAAHDYLNQLGSKPGMLK